MSLKQVEAERFFGMICGDPVDHVLGYTLRVIAGRSHLSLSQVQNLGPGVPGSC